MVVAILHSSTCETCTYLIRISYLTTDFLDNFIWVFYYLGLIMRCDSLLELSDSFFSRHRLVPKYFKHILLMFYNFPDTTIDNKRAHFCFFMGSCWSKIFYLTYHKIAFYPIEMPNLIYNGHQLFTIGKVSICHLGKVSQFHTSISGIN